MGPQNGKGLEKHFDFNEALLAFHNLFNLENKDERTIAILGGAFLEMALEHLLYAFFPEDEKEVNNLFEYNQPLGNFSNKISKDSIMCRHQLLYYCHSRNSCK